MPDVVSPETRSRMMAGIRGKDTKPEMLVRSGLFARGLRYRIHVRALPGKPDLVFAKHHAVVFVSGCFWHGHECSLFKWPSTNETFWREKIEGNRARDAACQRELERLDWRVATVWECSLRKRPEERERVLDELANWLRSGAGRRFETAAG